ncbi:uncharacterized protein H6S33_002495 [Morchella sextelata]|uniref:uncharacterized protein n=1 Tax=Morchella sextelata TaxID=1174677 RepID=UPI001D040B69|nr:uncharacterized protein H6S33_002495 [Morchella sextelata]KAH0607461.1 hypothetical protein H6S33_002495 [Morchella sextelata]
MDPQGLQTVTEQEGRILTGRSTGDEDKTLKIDDEKLSRRSTASADVAAGYFAVTREFVPGGVNGKPPERTSPAGKSIPVNDSPSVVQSMYSRFFDRRASTATADPNGVDKKVRRARNEFYVVLRHGHLMLYDDSDQTEVRLVISLSLYKVSIYGGGEPIPEGELYIRRNAICLSRKNSAVDPALDTNTVAMPFFLFSEHCSLKEDFYFALLKNQEKSYNDPATISPTPQRFEQDHIINLLQRLHSSEEHLRMNWVNGLFGRLFLAIYKTPDVEKMIRTRITKKIARVNKPNFLSDIVLQKVHVGEGVPYITNPRLKEFNADGDFSAEADVNYTGNFRLEVAAKATLQLPGRFRPREVNLVLSVVLKRLEGHAIIKIKPPPSNRIWMAFETMPKMELDIEPIVGSRQIIWNPILRIIESRVREVIAETLVLPHYDDTPFTDTINQLFRGGIWEEALSNGNPTESETGAEKGVVDDVDKDDALEEEVPEDLTENSLRQVNERTMSMPIIAQTATILDKQKSASIIGLSEPPDSPRGITRSPSLKSTHGERKTKSQRAQTLTTISPPSPSVITDAVNVTAVRGKTDVADKGVTSAVMSMSRSRSSSSPHSPSQTNPASPTGPKFNVDILTPDVSIDQASDKSSYSSSYEDRTDEVVSRARGIKGTPSPARSISESSARSLTATNSPPGPNTSDSTSNLANTIFPKALQEKPSFVAVASATAAVRNWYKTRNTQGESSSPSVEAPNKQSASRNLPPVTIPPPVAKKTPPINVPKRKSLPPPLLPSRNKTRATPAPPIPPRDLSPFNGGTDQLLVVAAPDSEPPSPSQTVDGEDSDYMRKNTTHNGSIESHLMFPSSSSKDSESASVSINSPGLPRRSRSLRTASGALDREREHERAVRREEEAEREVWHAAEEAELRTKVPWEPDESLT